MQIEITEKEIKNAIKVEFVKKDKLGEINYKNDVITCNLGKDKVNEMKLRKIIPNLIGFVKNMKRDVVVNIKELDVDVASYIFYFLILSETEIKNLKTEDKEKEKEKTIYLLANKKQFPELSKTSVMGDSINYVRELDFLPGNIATPSYINERVKELSKEWNLKYEFLSFKEIEELGMNAYFSVAKGSYNEPIMPVIKYNCKGAKKTI